MAVYRMRQIDALIERFQDKIAAGSNGGPSRSGFPQRKVAYDILNKVAFFSHTGEKQKVRAVDEVIPSGIAGVPELHAHLRHQLLANEFRDTVWGAEGGGRAAEERMAQHVGWFEQELDHAAEAVRSHATAESRKWLHRMKAGQKLSDRTLGVSLVPHPSDPEMVQLRWQDPSASGSAEHGGGGGGGANGGGGPEVSFAQTAELWKDSFESLKRLYEYHADAFDGSAKKLMLSRVFVMVLRYDALSHTKSAYQAAVPRAVMAVLQRRLSVRHECYASPLNLYPDHHAPSFNSVFPDTDKFFGSHGNFYGFRPSSGSFECNPPFDAHSIATCFSHVGSLLKLSDDPDGQEPLSFAVVIPAMTFNPSLAEAFSAVRPYLRRQVDIKASHHVYQMGLQHKRTGESKHWGPDKPSVVYFFQNDAGAAEYVVSDALEHELRAAFSGPA